MTGIENDDTQLQGERFWERVREIFQSAVEQPPADRARFVRDACGADHGVRDDEQGDPCAGW